MGNSVHKLFQKTILFLLVLGSSFFLSSNIPIGFSNEENSKELAMLDSSEDASELYFPINNTTPVVSDPIDIPKNRRKRVASNASMFAGGAYTLNFSAANPSDYIPSIPFPADLTAPTGRGDGDPLIPMAEFNDGATDVKVESLAPQDMALGQIVPFETKITVNGDTTPENGVITVQMGWNIETTNGGDFGYDEILGVIGAFIDTGDGAHIDLGDAATVSTFNWVVVGDEIVGTFTISGLDHGDMVVLEAWLVLEDTIPAGIGGNVQSRLIDAATGPDLAGDAISTGNQTVPLLKPSDFFTSDVDLSVTKSDDVDPIVQGEELTYEIIASNAGPSVANTVVVYDELDPNVTFVSASDGGLINTDAGDTIPDGAVQWDVGALAPGDSVTYTVTVTVNTDAPTDSPTGEDLINTVTVTTISDDIGPENNTDTEPTDVLSSFVPDPLISIVKTGTFANDGNADGFADAGESINYTFAVSNDGNVTLTNVTVTDPLITVSGGPTTLDVGETDTTTFSGTYIITQADIDAGNRLNTATADSDESDPADGPADTPLPQNPLISIVKTGTFANDGNADGFADAGESINYTFAVSNDGNVTLTNVTVTDPLITVSGGPTTLDVGETDTTTFSGTYIITQADIDAGNRLNTATADSDESDPADGPADTPLPQNPLISIVKTGTFANDGNADGFADAGESINYTFAVSNDGNVTLTNVTVTDPLITVSGGPTTLDVGETDTTTFSGTYIITQADIDAGNRLNTATADSDESDPADGPADTPLPQNPLISIVKTGTFANDGNADGFADAGESINYTFAVSNDGNVTLTNVTVTDPLITVSGGPTTLDVGETDTTTFSGTYIITQADIDAGNRLNTATADSDESDPADGPADTPLPQNPLISIVKTGTFANDGNADGFADAGESINYTFAVSNDGNVTLTNVTVTDPLITVSGGPTTLDVGETDTTTFSGTYIITQADIDAGNRLNTATADSDESDPADGPADTPLPQNPLISIVKTGTFANDGNADGFADAGESINYTFAVSNDGNVTLTNVTVTDPLITVSGGPTTLDVGETDTTTFSGTYIITQADIDAGNRLNTATADSDESDPADGPADTPLPQNPLISIVKTGTFANDGNADGFADAGESINYTFAVSNDGNVTLTNVTVTDPLITVSGGPTTLDVGETDTTTFSGTYIITQADIDAGNRLNTATADSDESDPADGPADTPLPQNPLISIVKTGTFQDENGDTFADVGETITYSFTVANEGNVSLTGVTVTDPLVTVAGGPIDLAVGGSDNTTFTGSYILTQADIDAGGVTNQATATGTDPNGDPVTDDSDDDSPLEDEPTVTPLPQNPKISIVKNGVFNDTDGDGFADVGETITYSFTVANEGNVSLTGVTVTDPLVTVAGGPIDLAVGGSDNTTFTGSYILTQADIDAGGVTNQATATGTDPNGDPVTDDSDDDSPLEDEPTVTPLPQNPKISIVKNGVFNDTDGDGFADVGETITYSFTVANEGNVSLTGVTVTDPLVTVAGGPIDLAVGGSDNTTFTGSYILTQADIDAGGVTNQATATGTDPNGDPVTDDSDDDSPLEDEPTVTPLPQNPKISIVKNGVFNDTDGDGFADVGETITYSFTVANEGNVSLTGVTVTDPLVTVAGGPIDLAVGGSDNTTFTGSYILTQADIDAGGVTNQATATGTDPNGDPVTDDSDDDSPLEDEPTVTPLPQNPKISIVKNGVFNDTDGDGFADVGETITYSFTVANEGNVSLTGVTVTDPLVTVAGGPIDLAVGGSDNTTFTGSYILTQADIDAGGVTNQATATGTDPNGDPVTDDSDDDSPLEDEPTVTPLPQNPSIATVKTFANIDGGALTEYTTVGQVINYTITLENDGNVTVYNPMMADATADAAPVRGVDAPGNNDGVLNVGEIWTYAAAYTVTQNDLDTGSYMNTAEGDGSADTTGDGNGNTPVESDDDENVDADQDPVISIVKNFAVDAVTAGGAGSSFTLLVTNEGNVTLYDAMIEDMVDARLTVTGVSGTTGVDDDSDGDAQTIEWLINTLSPGDSETVTVNFEVASNVEEANGLGGVNEFENVLNIATVAAEAPQGDPNDMTDDITDNYEDTIDIVVEINLSIVKTFDPTQIQAPQGTRQYFTIEVSNSGPSDAVDVSVTDMVDELLEVYEISASSGNVDCSASSGQNVNCTVQVPAGGLETITVEYMTAPFLDNDSPYDPLLTGGDDFYFKFVNGSILEGTTRGDGEVYFTDNRPEGDGIRRDITLEVDIVNSLTRNEITFDPPGSDLPFTMHLSCSDPFTGGWGQSAGPVEGVDVDWQIAYFTIARFNNNGYIKSCGNVVNPFDVDNTAFATGSDTVDGTETVDDEATVTIGPGIIIDRLQTKGKRLTVRLTNYTGEEKEIEDISIRWPESNGDLTKVWLTYGSTSDVIWQGNLAHIPGALDHDNPDLDSNDSGWNGGTLFAGEAILRFDFANKVDNSGYVIRVLFTDGTWLDISVDGEASQAASSTAESTTVDVTDTSKTLADVTTVEAYPIPFGNKLNLQIEIAYEAIVNVQLFDMDGRLVLNLGDHPVIPGTNTLQFTIDNRIPEAMLILKVDTGKEIISKTVLSRK